MATIHELPSKEMGGIPSELLDLDRNGLQEYMLGTIRESLFLAFETSPECVGVTLRREIGARYWDIALSRVLYSTTDTPPEVYQRFFWDAEPTAVGDHFPSIADKEMGREGFESPQEAYDDAREYLAKQSAAGLAEGEGEGPF